MAYLVAYDVEIPYRPLPKVRSLSPALEVSLHFGGRVARAVGILDSGSMHTVFTQELATQLGISDITVGRRDTLRSAAGPFDIFLFDVELEVHAAGVQRKFSAQVGFAERHLPRNILGLNVVFQQFQIGFRDSRQRVYLLPEP